MELMSFPTTSQPVQSAIEEKQTSCSKSTNSTCSEIAELLRLILAQPNMTKWKLAKTMGVTWHTVYCWQKGVFNPTAERMNRLRELSQGESL